MFQRTSGEKERRRKSRQNATQHTTPQSTQSKHTSHWVESSWFEAVCWTFARRLTFIQWDRQRESDWAHGYNSNRVTRVHRSDWCRTCAPNSMYDESVPSRRFSSKIHKKNLLFSMMFSVWNIKRKNVEFLFAVCFWVKFGFFEFLNLHTNRYTVRDSVVSSATENKPIEFIWNRFKLLVESTHQLCTNNNNNNKLTNRISNEVNAKKTHTHTQTKTTTTYIHTNRF